MGLQGQSLPAAGGVIGHSAPHSVQFLYFNFVHPDASHLTSKEKHRGCPSQGQEAHCRPTGLHGVPGTTDRTSAGSDVHFPPEQPYVRSQSYRHCFTDPTHESPSRGVVRGQAPSSMARVGEESDDAHAETRAAATARLRRARLAKRHKVAVRGDCGILNPRPFPALARPSGRGRSFGPGRRPVGTAHRR